MGAAGDRLAAASEAGLPAVRHSRLRHPGGHGLPGHVRWRRLPGTSGCPPTRLGACQQIGEHRCRQGAVADREQGGRRPPRAAAGCPACLAHPAGRPRPRPVRGAGGGEHSCRKTAQARARRKAGGRLAAQVAGPRAGERGRAAHAARGAGRGSQLPPGRPGSEAGLSRAMGACGAGTPRAWGRRGRRERGGIGLLATRPEAAPTSPMCGSGLHQLPAHADPKRDPGRGSPRHPAWSPAPGPPRTRPAPGTRSARSTGRSRGRPGTW